MSHDLMVSQDSPAPWGGWPEGSSTLAHPRPFVKPKQFLDLIKQLYKVEKEQIVPLTQRQRHPINRGGYVLGKININKGLPVKDISIFPLIKKFAAAAILGAQSHETIPLKAVLRSRNYLFPTPATATYNCSVTVVLYRTNRGRNCLSSS